MAFMLKKSEKKCLRRNHKQKWEKITNQCNAAYTLCKLSVLLIEIEWNSVLEPNYSFNGFNVRKINVNIVLPADYR